MTPAEFLAARLDEAEALANAATPGPWKVGTTMLQPGVGAYGTHVASMGIEKRMLLEMSTGYYPSKHVATAEHIAANDPARVLREVAAKRAHLDAYLASVRRLGVGLSGELRRVVEADAAVYGDHPDYPADWPLAGGS